MKTNPPLPPQDLKDFNDRFPVSNPRSWKKDRRVWAAAAVVAAAGVWALGRRSASHPKASKGGGAVPVGVAAARSGDMPVYLDGLGSVAAFYTVTVHSRVDGQLMSVPVREGQDVKPGDLLAQVDPRPFQAALDQAEGQLARDTALLTNAKLDLERYKGLIALDAIPKQQLDTQTATVGQDEGTVKNDTALVEAAKLQLDYAAIKSPISGRIGLRQTDPGNIVHANDPSGILVITQLHPISVVFTLPEDNLPAVMKAVAKRAKLPVTAYNRDKSAKLADGYLQTVDNQIDPGTGTSKLKAVFDNKENSLFPNQFVNVRMLLDVKKGQVIVPTVAIQRGSSGSFVYAVKPDGTVEARPVTVGVVENGDSSIDSGLSAGDTVVVDGADNLQPGSKVQVAAPAAPATPPAADAGAASAALHRGHKAK
ncbi:MAG TPA: MdtA/MuxA family multidrug efflux RND transporter periplasmic adaptor subunit [Elusimicrobiota bacterium]|nr:MdtA/MuxA family multidrug efflux RND transporter periplasmic adaptor subunit [Elusimicrobiota bacterium]